MHVPGWLSRKHLGFIRVVQVACAGVKLNASRLVLFRSSTLLAVLSNIIYVGTFVLFWDVIFDQIGTVPGWSFDDMIVYLGFVEVFFAVLAAFFGSATKFHALITSGGLDLFLVRPVDARILAIVMGFRIEYLVRSAPSVAALFIYSFTQGAGLDPLDMLLATAIALLAAVTLAVVQMSASCLAFWLGSMRSVEEFTQALTVLAQYPTTIMTPLVKALLTFLLPIGYAATEPALIAVANVPALPKMLGVTVLLMGWLLVSEFIWHKGLDAYESYGG